MSRRSRSAFPLDIKTGRLAFTPVLKATGKRIEMYVDYFSFPFSKEPGYHGTVTDLDTGRRYEVYGKECDIPGCHCDAWAVEIDDGQARSREG